MNDIYLKFPDQQTAEAMLVEYTGSVDVIGVIYRPTGEMLLGEDGEYPEMAPLDGWHVNVRGELNDALVALLGPYAVTPAHPVRVWV